MNNSISKTSSKLILSITFITSLIILSIFNRFIINTQKYDNNITINNAADIIALRIQNSLENRFSLIDALGAIYETYPNINEKTFQNISKAFIKNNRPVRAIQIADKETYVKFTYPVKTNEKVYQKPIKLIDDSLRGQWVKQTIKTKEKSIQTPFELRQGGLGTVVRKAVYKDTSFIGLAIGVINLSDILNECFSHNENKKYFIQMSDNKSAIFFENNNQILNYPVSRKILFPGTIWYLNICKNTEYNNNLNLPLVLLWSLGIIITILLLLFEILILNYNKQLEQTLTTRTNELKESQLKLNKVENLRTLGQLAGGIAHNFNNQLNSIIGFSELIKSESEIIPTIYKYAQKLLLVSKNSAELISKITSFSRQGKYTENEIDIHSILNLLSKKYSKNSEIQFILNLRAEKPIIKGDYSEINRAFNNILQNSIEAISNDGAIIINTETILIDESDSLVVDDQLKSGDYIHIHIEDNGKGISEDFKSHLFEPFFTTKDIAYGAGMGLASTYGTILEHDGHIEIESKVNKWTVVSIYLPII